MIGHSTIVKSTFSSFLANRSHHRQFSSQKIVALCFSERTMGPWARVVDSISSKLAFFPPSPPTYEVRKHDDSTGELYINPTEPHLNKVVDSDVFWVDYTSKGHSRKIIAARIPYRHPGGIKRRTLTILHSHGNAVDLGQSMQFLKEFSQRLGCHVVGYDYSGYGCSAGKPQARSTLTDIKALFEKLKERHDTDPKDIILYGQSLGSGPTIYLGSMIDELAGVVLHSPLLSGMRVINSNLTWWPSWADIYPNYRLMPKVKAPTLVMHGLQDEVIEIGHGQMLQRLAPNAVEGFWPNECDHQNIESSPQFFPTLKNFIAHVMKT